jgi:hypothetical protein
MLKNEKTIVDPSTTAVTQRCDEGCGKQISSTYLNKIKPTIRGPRKKKS